MKAIVCTAYGPPEVLQLKEVEKPAPKPNEVLIKVHATAVTASDTIVRGFKLPRWSPMGIMMGLAIGWNKPRKPILGMVVAGEVEAVGGEVGRLRAGELIYGSTLTPKKIHFGAYAEYLCLPEDSLITRKPASLSFEEAAAIPYGAGLALFFLKGANLQRGQKVLVYGASGAIGTAAVQIARHYGAEVTGVCSAANIDLVKSLGAGAVIDYTKEDAADHLERYDAVFDAVGKAKRSTLKDLAEKALTPNGTNLSVDVGSPSNTLEDFDLINGMVESGELRPVIDRSYPLEQMAEAHRYVDQGHKRGNVVIVVAPA